MKYWLSILDTDTHCCLWTRTCKAHRVYLYSVVFSQCIQTFSLIIFTTKYVS